MQAALIPGRRTALWLALAAVVLPSPALELGPAEVRSGLGEKLDARIPLRAREGEWFHARCLELTREAVPGVPALTDGVLSVERRRTSTNLRIRSAEPVTDPALAFGVTSNCSGAPRPLGPPVTLLIDPPRVDRASAPGARQTQALGERSRAAPKAPAAAPRAVERARAKPAAMSSAPPPSVAPRPADPVPPRSIDTAPAPKARPGEFVLRLSSAPIDVARAGGLDDKSRARLRERLRLLESDDQVAELLSMRDNMRRLEARVAELQLKLASMPPAFPPPAQVAKGESKPEATAATAAKPAPMPREPSAIEPPRMAESPTTVAPAPETKAAPASPASEPAAAKPQAPPPARAKAPEPAPGGESILDAMQSFKGRLIAAGIAILVLLLSLGAWLWSRWRNPPPAEEAPAPVDEGPATTLMERETVTPDLVVDEPIEIAAPAPARAEMASDAGLATRLGEDTEALRRRYLEERFPEIKAGSIVLDDPGSVVKGARLFYEDGAMPRAVELLRYAVEARPEQVRPWLALFEIYRLERLPGEYGELAASFRERHGDTPQWPKVCSFGRELDPANTLFQEASPRNLETIGPADARRRAAAQADPLVENWLEAPMDFENEVLASELRRSLMARSKVEDRDLVPNPMPALRSVEMFSVG